MRNTFIAALLVVFVSATAIAGGSGHRKVQTRWGEAVSLNTDLCDHVVASAKVHENGARIKVQAWGCIPGHVFTVWGIVGPEFEFGGENITLNCGGGVSLPNGRLTTICDVPRGVLAACLDCAQVLIDLYDRADDPRDEDFHIDIFTHGEIVDAISMSTRWVKLPRILLPMTTFALSTVVFQT